RWTTWSRCTPAGSARRASSMRPVPRTPGWYAASAPRSTTCRRTSPAIPSSARPSRSSRARCTRPSRTSRRTPTSGYWRTRPWSRAAMVSSPTNPLTGVGALAIVLVAVSLLLIAYAVVALWRGQLVLVRAANTDALTGLYNRRRLTADLNAGLRRATAGDPLLLILCDLNGFKVYNDTFGHPAGDALLTRLGGTLVAALHGRASAYRIGGDEFCVLARPGT